MFVDTPKKFCFSRYNTIENLPKPTFSWVQVTTETYEQIQQELPQPVLLVNEITNGIRENGYFVVDFGDYSTLLKYLFQDWLEKWDKYTALEAKITEEQKGFVNIESQQELNSAEQEVMSALDKWIGLIRAAKNKKE